MNILCLDYCMSNFHNLVELAHDGHTVYMTGNDADVSREYYDSLGITVLDVETSTKGSLLDQFMKENKIDLIINQNPMMPIPRHWKSDYEFIGLNELSSNLETHKLWCRSQVEKLGVPVPKLLDRVTAPCVVKPNKILHDGKVHCAMVALDDDAIKWVKYMWGVKGIPYYIEEYIEGTETNVEFVVSGGKWSISHIQASTGEGKSKRAGQYSYYTKYLKYKEVSDGDRFIIFEETEKVLDWIASLGGSFQGQLTGIIRNGKWYFIEVNSRLAENNSTPIFVRGEEYLQSLREGNPDLLADAIYCADMDKIVVHPRFRDSVYPINLHEKYGVSIPCGLDIVDGEYIVPKQVGLVIIDDHIPSDFVKELKNNLEFIVSP